MSESDLDLPQGTLDLLILKAVALRREHGWAIARRIRSLSSDVLRVRQGSLYPALHRLENRGLIRSSWGISENNRRAKYYQITAAGRRRLERETGQWERLTTAVDQVLAVTSA
ncbi:MAG: PadR family transcriptional regulator [Acidobacteriota bacterium]